ncbi:unnamed protein product [Durusdinium trenchii]|uniref:Transmembrane protein 18 n=1 Tax=Durusdinium trenchii TaxID=1381693 RepID=A0ABP0SCP7_9DINO
MEGLNFSASEWLGAVEDVLKSHLTGENRYTQSFTEDVQAFVHAIDWRTDFWIFGLFLVEFLDLLMVVINRRSWERLAMIFLANTGILYCAEWLNQLASKNWKTFSSQDYFDKAGVGTGDDSAGKREQLVCTGTRQTEATRFGLLVFASVLVGLPLLLCQFLIVGFLLKEAGSMVIQVKRLELKQARKKAKDE